MSVSCLAEHIIVLVIQQTKKSVLKELCPWPFLISSLSLPASSSRPSMDLRALALLAFALAVISLSEEKPVSLTYRCPCRFYESNVARANIKHLKILSTPNCSLQIVARLKSNSKQVCIDPKLKWIQEYLEKALNK